jgi:hypothetical protein
MLPIGTRLLTLGSVRGASLTGECAILQCPRRQGPKLFEACDSAKCEVRLELR